MQDTLATIITSLAADKGAGGGQAQAVDLLVDRGVFFNIDVALGDICLGLIIIVVTDEIMHRIVGEKFLEFAVELSGQRLVVRHDQRGPLHRLNDVGHGESLARSGHAHQDLLFFAGLQAGYQGFDGLGLISGGLKWAD